MKYRELKQLINVSGLCSMTCEDPFVKLTWETVTYGENADGDGDGIEILPYIENTGTTQSGRIKDICFLSIDVPDTDTFKTAPGICRRILFSQGSTARAEDFRLRELSLHTSDLNLKSMCGRSSSGFIEGAMPYFNYCQDTDNGLFACIGWSGRWRLHIKQKHIYFYYPEADFTLRPGEKIALPSALLVPWSCKTSDNKCPEAFNVFRRFMKKYISMKVNGKTYEGDVCLRTWGSVNAEGHMTRWANMKKYSIPSDAYGVDADWYDLPDVENRDWFKTVGDWDENMKLFPAQCAEDKSVKHPGLKWMADGGRNAGSKGYWLWIEFERAVKKSLSVKNHPEYYMFPDPQNESCLLRFQDEEARNYLKSKLYPIFSETNMTIFRTDFNIDPVRLFRIEDKDENGITELRYYNGVYAFLGNILKDFPGIAIDNCASGGRRLDYRMIRYAVPVMCRSDFMCVPEFNQTGAQAITMALARWLPVQADSCASCTVSNPVPDTYRIRSSYSCGVSIAAPDRLLTPEEGKWYRDMLTEASMVQPYMSLDFYPLTGYSLYTYDWAAWEAVSYDGSKALVMAFRREDSPESVRTFALHGLCADSKYEIYDASGKIYGTASGASLTEGYSVCLPEKRSSAVLFFRKL